MMEFLLSASYWYWQHLSIEPTWEPTVALFHVSHLHWLTECEIDHNRKWWGLSLPQRQLGEWDHVIGGLCIWDNSWHIPEQGMIHDKSHFAWPQKEPRSRRRNPAPKFLGGSMGKLWAWVCSPLGCVMKGSKLSTEVFEVKNITNTSFLNLFEPAMLLALALLLCPNSIPRLPGVLIYYCFSTSLLHGRMLETSILPWWQCWNYQPNLCTGSVQYLPLRRWLLLLSHQGLQHASLTAPALGSWACPSISSSLCFLTISPLHFRNHQNHSFYC